MLRVRPDMCLGCGLCTQECPTGAISLRSRLAHIDQRRCNHCGICVDVCPQGAIVESMPVSEQSLKCVLSELKRQTDDLLARIDRLRG
ncbi:MAG: hypothetical protein DRI39_05765 [Chloroflexi bacterium]|nr:MAG: hypothetical protein DRI39_05765 [Chloroflexota bacterium]